MRSRSSGSLLKGVQTDPPQRITRGPGDGRTPVSAGLPELRGARRHCVGSWSTIHLPCVESLLPPARSHGELVLRLPSPDKLARLSGRYKNSDWYLRAYCQEDQHSWSRFLPWAEYAQNSLRQNTTGLTPFQCILGYQPPLFPWTGEPSEVPAVDHWFRASKRVWDSAHIHLQRAVWRHKEFAAVQRAPTPLCHPGDRVWLSTRDIRLRLPCKKLSPRYIGPFKIQRQINEVTRTCNS